LEVEEKVKKILSSVLAMVLIVSLVACGSSSSDGSAAVNSDSGSTVAENNSGDDEMLTVRVGCILPYSGAATNNSEAASMAIEAYEQYFYEKMGWDDGRNIKIEWVYGDSESTAEGAASAFERLVNFENVDVVIGTSRGVESTPLVPLAIKYQVPFILLHTVANALVDSPNDYVFRPVPGDTQEAKDHAAFFEILSEQQGGITTMGLVYSAEDYGTGAANLYREIAANNNVEIVLDESVQIGVADVSSVVNKIRNLNPDVILSALQINEALLFQKTLAEYNVTTPIIARGAGYLDLSFLDAANDTAEGVVSSNGWCIDTLNYLDADSQRVAQDMMGNAGVNMNEVSNSAWITTGCLFDAINRAETLDRAGIAAALRTLDLDFDHPANMFAKHDSISFGTNVEAGQYNQNQHTHTQFSQIIDGEWKVVYPEAIFADPTDNPLIWPPND